MDRREKLIKGVNLLKNGQHRELSVFMRELKQEDPLAHEVLELWRLTILHMIPAAIRKGTSLLSRVAGDTFLLDNVLSRLTVAYKIAGEIELSENYLLRRKQTLQELRGERGLVGIEVQQLFFSMFKAENHLLVNRARSFLQKDLESQELRTYGEYILASALLLLGEFKKALDILRRITEHRTMDISNFVGAWEMRGIGERFIGDFEASVASLNRALDMCLEIEDAYASFPCAKLLEMARLAGTEPPEPNIVRKCLSLSRKGGDAEKTAAKEMRCFLDQDDHQASVCLFEVAKAYSNVYQPLEAFRAAADSLLLSWKARGGPVIWELVSFIGENIREFKGFKKDPLVGKILSAAETLAIMESETAQSTGLRAKLLGEFELWINNKKIDLSHMYNKKAVRLLLYLLLAPKHRLPKDHLAYLIWPKEGYSRSVRKRLYVAASHLRNALGNPNLLINQSDFYQLKDVWTDLGEIEHLLRRAESSHLPEEKQRLLSRARELARGELLPEFPYDRHIEEYRRYYRRLKQRLKS